VAALRDLLLRHSGATIAVLGGGESLPEQAARLPADAICLSANQHGCLLRPCDYIVAIDSIEANLRRFGLPIIAPQNWADYRVSEHPQLPYTGMHAAWVAWMLGARLILLAGMDCYVERPGGQTWWHGPDTDGRERQFRWQERGWRMTKACVEVPIRSMGGPTVEIFGAYDQAEVLPPYVPSERPHLLAQCAGIRVEILKDHRRGKFHKYFEGQVLELPRDEALKLMAQRIARRHT
jgi:hypothetical protein